MTLTLRRGIHVPPHQPFYDGSPSATSADVPGVYPVAIAGHGYVIEAKE